MPRIFNNTGRPVDTGPVGGRSPGPSRRSPGLARLALASVVAWLAACTSLPQQGSDGGAAPARSSTPRSEAANPAPITSSTPAPTVYEPLPPISKAANASPPLDEIARMNLAKRDLWGRIRAGFAMPDLDTPLVAQKEKFYLERPDYLQRMFDRGSRYLHHIVEEIEKRGMPTELALLPFVESAMNPTALSSAKAAGLWQFIPSTGKQYDLSQNWWVDNRRDVVQSTRAALDYLQTIYEMHGNDWFLALASYNWGEGAVGRAVKRNRALGKPADYLSLSMPTETRHYIPKLIALKHIVLRADELGLLLPALPDKPYFVTIEKTRPIDLKLAAEFAQMSIADFVALNPAHNRPVIAASKNNVLKIPADRIDAFTAAIARHETEEKVFASWQPYTLKPNETLDDVARRGNVTPAELLRANSIATDVRILPGTRILAPQKLVRDESLVEDFQGARVYQLVNLPPSYHRVQRRETPASIARRYGLSLEQLRGLNGNLAKVRPGSLLLVRRATTQTVLVTETGHRQVVRNHGAPVVRTSAKATDGDDGTAVSAAPRKQASKPSAKRAVKAAPKAVAKPTPRSAPKSTQTAAGAAS